MSDVVVGIVAVLIGALLCFRGYAAMRLLISLFGAFWGFLLGAGLVASFTGSGLLQLVIGWLVGIVSAVVFGVVAYFSYQVAIVIGMGAIGFALGTSIMAALGVSWSWLIVLVGVLAGVVLAVVAIVGDLPALLLAVLTALAGANLVVFGVLLTIGVVELAELGSGRVELSWWWYAAYLVLALIGMLVQAAHLSRAKRTLREQWGSTPPPRP